MTLANNPIFLQSAGNNTPVVEEPVLRFMFNEANPTIQGVTGTGDIIVKSVKGGVEMTQTVTDPSGDSIAVQADKNTWIYLEGEVTEVEHSNEVKLIKLEAKNTALTSLNCSECSALQTLDLSANTALTSLSCSLCSSLQTLDLSTNTALTSLNCNECGALQTLDLSTNTALTSLSCSLCYALQTLDLSTNTALTRLDCSDCYVLQTLDLSTNTALTSLNCNECYALQTLDLSTNTALTRLDCESCSALQTLDLSTNTALTNLSCSGIAEITSISYPATNSDVADAIAAAITAADAEDGTVYTDSAADYYSTIADAATAKGWTIEQLTA